MGSNRRQTLGPITNRGSNRSGKDQPREQAHLTSAIQCPYSLWENTIVAFVTNSANSRSVSPNFWQLKRRKSPEMSRYRSTVESAFLKLALRRGSELKSRLWVRSKIIPNSEERRKYVRTQQSSSNDNGSKPVEIRNRFNALRGSFFHSLQTCSTSSDQRLLRSRSTKALIFNSMFRYISHWFLWR